MTPTQKSLEEARSVREKIAELILQFMDDPLVDKPTTVAAIDEAIALAIDAARQEGRKEAERQQDNRREETLVRRLGSEYAPPSRPQP